MASTNIDNLKKSQTTRELKAKEPATIHGMLKAYQNQIAAALPKHITADRMARLALTSIRRNTTLGKADPVSLFGAIIQSAQLGLEPGITAHLVPFWSKQRRCHEVQMIPDYRGLVALARRSGEITRFKAEVVRENDEFDYQEGTEQFLKHKPAMGNRGEIIGAYAVAKYKDSDDSEFVFMPKEDIDAIRARSKSSDNGPWVTDYAAMAKKTVAKQLCKWLPVSVELQQAVQLDDLAEVGKSQGNEAVLTGDYEVVPEEEEPERNPQKVKALLEIIEKASSDLDFQDIAEDIAELDHPEDRAECLKALEERKKIITAK